MKSVCYCLNCMLQLLCELAYLKKLTWSGPVRSGFSKPPFSSYLSPTFLQPIMKNTPFYTKDFVNKLEPLALPPDTLLVIIDVSSSCTSVHKMKA